MNEALEEELAQHAKTQWPKGFFDFAPIEDVPDFQALRHEGLTIEDWR